MLNREQRSHLLEDKLVSRPVRTNFLPTPPLFFFLIIEQISSVYRIEGDYTPEITLNQDRWTHGESEFQNYWAKHFHSGQNMTPTLLFPYLYITGLFSSWQLFKDEKNACTQCCLVTSLACHFGLHINNSWISPHLSQITRIGKEHTSWWVTFAILLFLIRVLITRMGALLLYNVICHAICQNFLFGKVEVFPHNTWRKQSIKKPFMGGLLFCFGSLVLNVLYPKCTRQILLWRSGKVFELQMGILFWSCLMLLLFKLPAELRGGTAGVG